MFKSIAVQHYLQFFLEITALIAQFRQEAENNKIRVCANNQFSGLIYFKFTNTFYIELW